ncbi:ribbon-helix-helix domain-containing protein [Methylomonas sp. CM2]|uniref:ribbon-helix-helix domain-containing protein n=1 Tax=Methylomonas sp. CM2 TaxID=3417647 RepID=UPI003CEC29BF
MTNVEKISIALTPELANILRQCVESCEYASSSELVREALRDWKTNRSLQKSELQVLKSLWQTGIDSGSGKFTDMDAIKMEARKRLASSTK